MEQIKNLEDLVWWIASKHEENLISFYPKSKF